MAKETDKEEILKSAKKIVDNFHNALSNVEKETQKIGVERERCERKEKTDYAKEDKNFREIMMKNAPETEDNFIKAEKGAWT